jgi:hypothetical protein
MEQADLVEHYRRIREIAGDIQNGALALVQYSSLVKFGRRVGIPSRHGVFNEDEGDQKLVFDLAVHTVGPGRSRAIDRYARTAPFVPGTELQRVMHALQRARFCVFQFESRHPVAGAVAHDILEDRQFHFMDVAVGLSGQPGDKFVGRLVEVDGFRMSCLTIIPIIDDLLDRITNRLPSGLADVAAVDFQDPHFAILFYRAAVGLGIMQRCVTFDPSKRVPTESDIKAIMSLSDHRSQGSPALTRVG